jgi:hypothetical protein
MSVAFSSALLWWNILIADSGSFLKLYLLIFSFSDHLSSCVKQLSCYWTYFDGIWYRRSAMKFVQQVSFWYVVNKWLLKWEIHFWFWWTNQVGRAVTCLTFIHMVRGPNLSWGAGYYDKIFMAFLNLQANELVVFSSFQIFSYSSFIIIFPSHTLPSAIETTLVENLRINNSQ